jgi:hypothetical protein
MPETLLTTTTPDPATTANGTTTAPPSEGKPAAPASWRDGLPPDLKDDKSLTRYTDVAALARGHVELQKYQGRSVAFPGENATPQEKAAFEQKVNTWRGVPESPEKYTLSMPEGLTPDEKGLGEWKSTFHRLGLTQDQVAGLADMYFGSPTGNPALAHDALRTFGETELKKEWGGAFGHNLAIAGRAIKRVGGPEVFQLLEQTGLNNHPAMVKFWHRLGKDYQEDGAIPTAQHGGPMGPDDARRKIAEIRADRTHPYHRGDRDALAEMQALYEVVSGTAV